MPEWLILFACFVIKTNGSRPQLHAVFPYSRVITEQALKIHLQCRYFSGRFLLGDMATFFACILTSHVFRVWLSLKAWPEHLSKYHFCSWRLRSNLFLAICQLILSLISLSCIWYGHICSWEIQFHGKPDKSISDRIQLWLDHVSGQEMNGKRGKGSIQRRNQRPELQPEICFEPNLERITQNNRKGQRTWRSSGLQ